MAKEEWGTKRVCPTTGKRFYDLGRDPVVSPYTGETVVQETGKGGRMMVADKPEKSKRETSNEESEEEVVLEDDNENDNNVDLGDDVLSDDEDDSDDVSLDDIADVAEDDEDN